MKPSARCDAVGDVCEFVWAIDGDKVLEDGRSDQIRVELGHPVDLVASNGGEMGHSDHLWLSLLDDRYASEQVSVLGELLFDHLEEAEIDLIHDLKMPWQQVLHQRYRPLLQGLRHDCMVGVAKSIDYDVPGLIPFEPL